jgi:hypothetical protein
VNLVIQNATISSLFYFLRLDELFLNSLSTFVAFYSRHFINNGHQWHRKETDVFQFGYFYAQFLTFYTINLIFSSTVPFICPATLYFFALRHFSDATSLLTVHRNEIDSSGHMVNNILNFSSIPLIFFHLCMTSFFLVKEIYYAATITITILILSLIYIWHFSSSYIFDVYSLHEKLKEYEMKGELISHSEVNKWR